MTRRLDLVNLSNWQHEDYEVTVYGEGGVLERRMSPGTALSLHAYSDQMLIVIKKVETIEPEPFLGDDGNQITPGMEITFK